MTKDVKHYKELTTQMSVESLMMPEGGTAVIDVWAPWCRPCLAMAPAFEAVAARYTDDPVGFYKLNSEAHPRLSKAFNVRALPTVLFVHNGEVLDVNVGAIGGAALSEKVDWLLSKARGEGFLTRLMGKHRKKDE